MFVSLYIPSLLPLHSPATLAHLALPPQGLCTCSSLELEQFHYFPFSLLILQVHPSLTPLAGLPGLFLLEQDSDSFGLQHRSYC